MTSPEDMRRKLTEQREAMIDRFGWAAIHVFPKEREQGPPFTYTIGLEQTFASPEVVIVGFSRELGHSVLSGYVDALREKRVTGPERGGRFHGVIETFPVELSVVPEDAARDVARGAFDRAFPFRPRLLQLKLPDPRGRFPGDEACSSQYRKMQDILAVIS